MFKAIIASLVTFVLGALAMHLEIECLVSVCVMGFFIIYFNEKNWKEKNDK